MLSGIGPLDQMIAHNISQIADLPVGHNLQDHVGLGGLTFVSEFSGAIAMVSYHNKLT